MRLYPRVGKKIMTSGWLRLGAALTMFSFAVTGAAVDRWVVYEGGRGPGNGKKIVLIAGDEEYRSEEGLAMLGKILAQRHGFRCTVLFSQDEDATINPNNSS